MVMKNIGGLGPGGSSCLISNSSELVPPYTLDDFMKEIGQACEKAWLSEWRDIVSIKLPMNLFPCLAEIRNPITRSVIKVERVELLDLCDFSPNPWANKR